MRHRRMPVPVLAIVALALAATLAATPLRSLTGAPTGVPTQPGESSTPFAIDFKSSFDGETYAPWQEVQYEFDRPRAESFNLVTSPVRSGRYAAQFIARQGYDAFGYNEAVELCCGPSPHEGEGSDYWYAWSTLFPTTWVSPYRWGIVLQWHTSLPIAPALAFNAGANDLWIQLRTGLVTGSSWSFQRSVQILPSLSVGRWNDFVLHVVWSAYPRGSVEIWHRLAGEPRFRKVVSLFGVPTLQRTRDAVAGTYVLLGIYRASYCAQPTRLGCTSSRGTQPDTVVYHDEFRRATARFPWCLACLPRRSPRP